jgi:acid phosphatase type 7
MNPILRAGVPAILALAGLHCAGSGKDKNAAGAQITLFQAHPEALSAGESTTLKASYTGGTGRVDPGGLSLASGAVLTVSPAKDTVYTLTVTPSSGAPATRSLTVKVKADPKPAPPDPVPPVGPTPPPDPAPVPGPIPGPAPSPQVIDPKLHASFLGLWMERSTGMGMRRVPGCHPRWVATNARIVKMSTRDDLWIALVRAVALGPATLQCEVLDRDDKVVGTSERLAFKVKPALPEPAWAVPPPAELERGGGDVTLSVVPGAGFGYFWKVNGKDLVTHDPKVTFRVPDGPAVEVECAGFNPATSDLTRTLKISLPIRPRQVHNAKAFLVAPYLQLGPSPSPTRLELLWMTPPGAAGGPTWTVEYAPVGGAWVPADPVRTTLVDTGGDHEAPHEVHSAALNGLPAGASFTYRVKAGADTVFEAEGKALKSPDQPQRIAVVGDLFTSGHAAQSRALASRIHAHRPDLMVIPGDMVNMEGKAHQYRDLLFKGLNADDATPATGAPLMRSCPLVPCLGNNDTERLFELRKGTGLRLTPSPNSLAYYYYFSAPLNGPALEVNQTGASPNDYLTPLIPSGPHLGPAHFPAVAGSKYPVMGNYSFDSGNVHWTVLDSDLYMEWGFSHRKAATPPATGFVWEDRTPAANARLQRVIDWLKADLDASRADTRIKWRFVVFHHPAFNLSAETGSWKYTETWMRQIWPLLQERGVDLVFNGHLHGYQRSRPLTWAAFPGTPADGPAWKWFSNGSIPAHLSEDLAFTGNGSGNRARGVIQILTGAGGANPRKYPEPPPGTKPFPARLYGAPAHGVSGFESFSLLEIRGEELDFRQISVDGKEVDHFTLTH